MKINYFFIATINVVTLIAIAIFFGSCDIRKPPIDDLGAIKASEDVNDRRIAINKMSAHIVKIKTIYNSINDAFKKTGDGYGSGYADIAKHASEIEDLAKKILDEATILSSSDYKLIEREIENLLHDVHELEHNADKMKHHESHHKAEEMKGRIDTLEKDIQNLR